MDNNRNLKLGIIFSYISTIATFVVAILYTPFLLSSLGQQQYGLYNMGEAAVSYLSLAEFGFGNAIVRYATKYRAEGDEARTEKLYGTFFYLYMAMAVLILVVGLIIITFIDRLYTVSTGPDGYNELRIIMVVMVLNLAFTFSTTIYSSIIVSYERFTFQKVTNLIYIILKPVVMIPLLIWGFKAIALSIVTFVLTVLLQVANIVYVRKELGVRIEYNIKVLDFKILKGIAAYSVFVFIDTIVAQLNSNVDNIILGTISGEIAVAIYSVGATLNSYAQMIPTTITSVFFPRVTTRVTKGASLDELSDLMLRIGRIEFILSVLIMSGFVFFGQDFILLWAGKEYLVAYWIVLWLIIPGAITNLQGIGVQILQAMNRHQFRAICYVICAVLNAAISIPVGLKYGPVGCAACTGITLLITKGVLINWFYQRKIGLNVKQFWNNLLKIFIKYLPMICCGLVLNAFISDISWLSFAVKVILYSMFFFVYTIRVVMNSYEKTLLKTFFNK